ncbi:MAG: Unknown protein [uncultured Sulfurovum sp.]|uniref:Protein kinase n=1 Tax=uncultured Sulfurovum sp. TaxID=269237 RepID=A0A6S6TWQ1_9BACT|nr:MAG: Unknown protein [uncultured Sulfurovum sp.]
MNYILKHFDNNLIKFTFNKTPRAGTTLEILEVYKTNKTFFPLNLNLEDSALLSWIKSRTIPKNREYVYKVLVELNLSFDDIEGIVNISKSLSLNDCYWIVEEDFEGLFSDYNLYDNDFNKTLSLLAYTGYGSVKGQGFISSPEFTTNGMLAKAWRKDPLKRKGIFLYKSGSKGCANCGNEPYSEFYAFQIAKVMGLDVTSYSLAKWKGEVNSVCELFSSKEYSFVPIYRLVSSGGWDAVLAYYENLGEEFYEALIDMIIFDVIIVNTDRHFGNFGVLVDNKTNKIVKSAPIFDNGLSLFYDAMEDDLERVDDFAKIKGMKNAGDFMTFATSVMTMREKKKVRKLINFKFEKHPTYNLPAKRLKVIEGFIERRVQALLAI